MPSTVDARAPAGGDELATAFKVVGTARAQLATVDEMLREAKP
jgi:hypothetical protein